ncbi:probable carbohydrate esterase At4g34215 isoform X1 [Cannabis sativa]|uniref:probable carbohydrate esterase At4g34215 isoform X1 n=2 Tax=Cannabis sativa TaxID=3483 RepID=UPI0029C9D1A3|nr:probable carbohydrate esterase At4g34215 isoform X1 [Cannabis sativa]
MATETSVSDNQNPEINSPNKQIFILSGQSNMAGRGGVNKNHKWDGVVPPECRPNHGILRLSAKLHWETAHEPTHKDIDTKKTCGVGPGMAFANAVKAHLAQFGPVGLVPSAVGGTAIKEWARGEHLYEDMIKRAKESVKRGGEIRALLWYQGESDTSSEDQVEVYQEKMEKLIQNVRQDLSLPSLPIIQVAIISGVDKNCAEKLREVQLNMKVENVVCVDAKGLELKFDNLHLTTEAQVELGQKLAQAYLSNFGPTQYQSQPEATTTKSMYTLFTLLLLGFVGFSYLFLYYPFL